MAGTYREVGQFWSLERRGLEKDPWERRPLSHSLNLEQESPGWTTAGKGVSVTGNGPTGLPTPTVVGPSSTDSPLQKQPEYDEVMPFQWLFISEGNPECLVGREEQKYCV